MNTWKEKSFPALKWLLKPETETIYKLYEYPEFNFPGLKDGDKWCLCAMRWREALEEGFAPRVILDACHESALKFVSLDELKSKSEKD